jgi:PAS domain S-box-containing protein
VKDRRRTAAKTHTKRVKRKGSDAPMIARRDDRVAHLKKQVNALTRELAEAERQWAQFAILVQSVKDFAIYMLDKAGHITSWNSGAERIKGYTRDEIIGQHFSRFYTDFDRESGLPKKILRRAAVDGKFQGEGWRVRKDGSQFWASVVIYPIHDRSETLVGFAKVTRDVTERRQAQSILQRERDNKLMNAQAIVAAIAHEIRQPLTRITAGGSAAQRFLKMSPPEHDKAQAALEGIVNAGHRTSEVIEGFRALLGTGHDGRQLVDVNGIIRELLDILSGQLKDRQVEPRLELMSGLPHVYGNSGQLQEVMSNLVVNAIEAMETTSDRSRVLRVRTEFRDHKAVAVVVEDSGPGIDGNKLPDIFTGLVSTKPHGMGLGLAISRIIIDYHGGKLTASSDGKDGASFQFVLPIASEDRDGAPAQ